jgi:twitching motility protein PilT
LSLVPSLLQAIVRVDGEALVMHVGDKPYVVSPTGQVDLATRGLTLDAVSGIVNQLLPIESQRAFDEFGAVQFELPPMTEFPGEQFTVVAARGGDDVWAEIRRRRIEGKDRVPMELFDAPAVAAAGERPAVHHPAPASELDAVHSLGDLHDLELAVDVARPAEEFAAPAEEIDLDDLMLPDAEQLWPGQNAPSNEKVGPAELELTPLPPLVGMPPGLRVPVSQQPSGVSSHEAHAHQPTPVESSQSPPRPVAPPVAPAPAAPERPAAVSQSSAEVAPALIASSQPPPKPAAPPVLPAAPSQLQPPVSPAPATVTPSAFTTGPQAVPPASRRHSPPPPEAIASAPPATLAPPPPEATASAPPATIAPPPEATASVPPATLAPPLPAAVAAAPPATVAPPLPEAIAPVPSAAFVPPPPATFPSPPPAAFALSALPPLPPSQPAVVLPLTRSPIRSDVPAPLAEQALAGLDRLLRLAAARGASTLYISSASRPSVRVDGEVQILDGAPVLGPNDVEALLLTLMPERNAEALRTGGTSEWISDLPDVGRVRCLSFRDHRGTGGVFRMMPVRAVTAEQLGLSPEIQALAIEPEGLVLVAGPRSSGKRTLLSAFVDLINRVRREHVITIEKEINVVHERNGSFISQREVHGGGDELLAVVRAALREDPDVLVLDELRSAAVMNVALDAAASGQLVIGGLPAPDASGAIDRIIDLYPPEYRRQVQLSLAQNLRGVVSQVLLRKTGGGRLAAREVLINTPAVRSILAEGKTSQLPLAIEGGRAHGMVPLNDWLVGYVQSGAVDVREAYRRAADRAGFLALLKRQGLDTSAIERFG